MKILRKYRYMTDEECRNKSMLTQLEIVQSGLEPPGLFGGPDPYLIHDDIEVSDEEFERIKNNRFSEEK